MSKNREEAPNNWIFFIGILFLVVGSGLVAMLHGSAQLLAIIPFAVSAVCAYVYFKSVVKWTPEPRQ